MTAVERVIERIVRDIEDAQQRNGLTYQETVRAATKALVIINEKQRVYVNSLED